MSTSSNSQAVSVMPVSAKPAAKRRNRRLERFLKNKGAVAGIIVVLLFVLMAVFAGVLSPYNPVKPDYLAVRQPPSLVHPFGTDELGRDIITRIFYGARALLMAGVVSLCVALSIGTPLGLIAGYFGGLWDACISRIAEAVLAISSLVLAISIAAFLGPSLSHAMIAIGLATTPIFIRLGRGQVLVTKYRGLCRGRARDRPAASLDHDPLHPAAHHRPGDDLDPSWGSMINKANNLLDQTPWMSIFPGGAICLIVLTFNLLGDGLRDALDPRG